MRDGLRDLSLLLECVRKEGITITLSERDGFSYDPNIKTITIPYSINITESNNVHMLAHEFGHYIALQKRTKGRRKIINLARVLAGEGHFIPSVVVVFDEVEAWLKGYKFCTGVGISTKGYVLHSLKPLGSYIDPLITHVFKIFKHIISFYAIAFAATKTLKISSEKDIPHFLPPSLQSDIASFWGQLQSNELDYKFTLALFFVIFIVYMAGRAMRFCHSLAKWIG